MTPVIVPPLFLLIAMANGCAMAPKKSACEPPATPIEAYFLAWNTADRDVRHCLVSSIWSARGRYVDPSVDVTGVDGLVDHIGDYLLQSPGTRLVVTSPVSRHHGVLHVTWSIFAGDTAMLDGMDFGRVDADGRLEQIVGFFGPIVARPISAPVSDLAAGFAAQDATRRATSLAMATSETVHFIDPQHDITGRGAMDKMIGNSLAAGLLWRPHGGVDEHHGFVRFRWTVTTGDNTPVDAGIDVGELDEASRLRELVRFSEP